ncbi:unnamed protein product, partial [Rotaria socialis]
LSTDEPIQLDNVLSCYKKAISKIVDTPDDSLDLSNKLSSSTAAAAATAQLSADDPIALRAIKRFEERMNAAVPKPKKEDTSLAAKGKSSWSGSLSSTRKSLENLFKNAEQQLHPDSIQVDT